MSPELNKRLNPKRAAQLLIYDWLVSGGQHPKHMTPEQMNRQLEAFKYTITEQRHEEVLRHVENIIEPMRLKIANEVQNFAII